MKVAEIADVSSEAVQNEVKKAFKRRIGRQKKKEERESLRPGRNIQPADRNIRYENTRSAIAEEGVVRLLLLDPVLFRETDELTAEDFTSPFLKKTFEMICRRYAESRELPIASIMAELDPPEASQLTVIMQKPEELSSGKTAIRDYIEKIKTEKMKKTARENLLSVSEIYREKKGYGG